MIYDPNNCYPVKVYPTKTNPRQHQAWATSIMLSRGMQSVFVDASPGTGKTKIAIDYASSLYNNGLIDVCLIFAPAGVHEQWVDKEIPKHCPVDFASFAYSAQTWGRKYTEKGVQDFRTRAGLKFLAFNIETLSLDTGRDRIKALVSGAATPERILLVIDESHRLKNPKAKATKWAFALGKACGYRLALTGTPVGNTPFDLWSQYEILQPNFWGINHFMFTHRYGLFVKRKGNGRTFNAAMEKRDRDYILSLHHKGVTAEGISAITGMGESAVQYVLSHPEQETPYRNLDELKAKIDPVTFTIRKSDCLDLPPKTFAPITIELSKEQKAAYRHLKKDYLAEYQDRELTLDNKLVLSLRLQQICGGFFPSDDTGEGALLTPFSSNPKLESLIDHLMGEESLNKIIISAVFNAEVRAIYERIQKEFPHLSAAIYNGTVSAKEKNHIRERYTEGDLDIIIGHPKSIGTGLNLQNGDTMYIYSNTWAFIEREQLEDRIHRDGQKGTARYIDIYAKGTVDEKIADVLIERKDVAEYFKGVKDFSDII